MLSVYKFRKETIDILYYLFLIISIFYLSGVFLGIFGLDSKVLAAMIFFTIIDGVFL